MKKSIPEKILGSRDRIADLLATVVGSHIELMFEEVLRATHDSLRAAGDSQAGLAKPGASATEEAGRLKALAELPAQTGRLVVGQLASLMQQFGPLLRTDSEYEFLLRYRQTSLVKVFVKMQQFFLQLNIGLAHYGEDPRPNEPAVRTGFYLTLMALTQWLAGPGVKEVQALFMPFLGRDSPLTGDGLNSADLQERFEATLGALAEQYVRRQGQALSVMAKKAMDTPNWLKAKEPREPRWAVELMLKNVQEIAVELDLAYPRGYELPRPGPVQLRTGKRLLAESQLLRRGFETSLNELTYAAFMRNILARFLKTILELTRTKTFGTNGKSLSSFLPSPCVSLCLNLALPCDRPLTRPGYRQMQVDLSLLSAVLPIVLRDEGIGPALDQLLATTAERCIEVSPLDPAVAERICAASLAKWRGEEAQEPDQS